MRQPRGTVPSGQGQMSVGMQTDERLFFGQARVYAVFTVVKNSAA